MVGAFLYDNLTVNDGGAAFLWHGSSSGLSCGSGCPVDPTTTDWAAYGTNNYQQLFGDAIGTAGDVNGDGYDDVIIGAAGYGVGGGNNWLGAAYLYYGNNSAGLSLLPEQRRADDSVLISPGGQAISPEGVRFTTWAHSPFGRSHVRTQWEIKPEGTAFDGSGLGNSSWQDSTTAGYTFNELISGLDFETRYQWRVRLQAQPLDANDTGLITYQSRWMDGGTFFTALSGEQSISGTGTTNLLGQTAYVDVDTQGTLTNLSLRGYPATVHPQADFMGGLDHMLERYFTITPNTGASGFDITLCLNYDDAEVPLPYTENQLRLCRWTGSAWSCPERSNLSDTDDNLVCAENVTQLSDWTIGAHVGPNAVQLVSFQARAVSLAQSTTAALAAGLLLLGWLLFRKRA